MIKLGMHFWARQKNLLPISGFAYPGETLTAPAGSTYAWSVGGISRSTASTLALTVNDIGLPVTCSVDGKPCKPATVWHPNQISSVKAFFWAAQSAYSSVANGITDATAGLVVNGFVPFTYSISRDIGNDKNGKAAYYYFSPSGSEGTFGYTWCYWDGSQWILNLNYDDGNGSADYTFYSSSNTTYPWTATWSGGTATRQVTTYDVLTTEGQQAVVWRDLITNTNVNTVNESHSPIYNASILSTPSLYFGGVDLYSNSALRDIVKSVNYSYIFAGVKDNNDTTPINKRRDIVSFSKSNTNNAGNRSSLGFISYGTKNIFAETNTGTNTNSGERLISFASDSNYDVLTNESLWLDGIMNLRHIGSQINSTSLVASGASPVNAGTHGTFYIGADKNLSGTANYVGYMTAIILAADSTKMSDTDRSRIERFLGLLGGNSIIPLV